MHNSTIWQVSFAWLVKDPPWCTKSIMLYFTRSMDFVNRNPAWLLYQMSRTGKGRLWQLSLIGSENYFKYILNSPMVEISGGCFVAWNGKDVSFVLLYTCGTVFHQKLFGARVEVDDFLAVVISCELQKIACWTVASSYSAKLDLNFQLNIYKKLYGSYLYTEAVQVSISTMNRD